MRWTTAGSDLSWSPSCLAPPHLAACLWWPPWTSGSPPHALPVYSACRLWWPGQWLWRGRAARALVPRPERRNTVSRIQYQTMYKWWRVQDCALALATVALMQLCESNWRCKTTRYIHLTHHAQKYQLFLPCPFCPLPLHVALPHLRTKLKT